MMFDYIRGTLTKTSPLYVIIETGNIGYKLFVPANLHAHLPSLNESLLLYISFVIRENSQTLYGFLSQLEREFFDILLAVSGIGPKIALSILGHFTPEKIYEAIINNQIAILCKIPGIGRKSAERLIIELKDKLALLFPNKPQNFCIPIESISQTSLIKDAMSALINLGYNQSTSESAIKKTLANDPGISDLAKMITTALNHV